MPARDQDGLDYRTPVPVRMGQGTDKTSQNLHNYDTLKLVQKVLKDGIEGLYKDFNAFDVTNLVNGTSKMNEAKDKLFVQILGKQYAYDILTPIIEAVDQAVMAVDNKYKQR